MCLPPAVRKFKVLLLAITILLSGFAPNAYAAPKANTKCTSNGQRATIGSQVMQCKKSGTLMTWKVISTTIPNVVGMSLLRAETVLTKARIEYDEHALDSMMGIIAPQNWVVCKQVRLTSKLVRLDAAKYGC